MRRFFFAMFIGGLVALGYGGVSNVARADGAERSNTATFAAVQYYVWYQFPGRRWYVDGPYTLYDASNVAARLRAQGARTNVTTRP